MLMTEEEYLKRVKKLVAERNGLSRTESLLNTFVKLGLCTDEIAYRYYSGIWASDELIAYEINRLKEAYHG